MHPHLLHVVFAETENGLVLNHIDGQATVCTSHQALRSYLAPLPALVDNVSFEFAKVSLVVVADSLVWNVQEEKGIILKDGDRLKHNHCNYCRNRSIAVLCSRSSSDTRWPFRCS